jgi:hypothetical protein
MAEHDYTPEDALHLLLKKLRARDVSLATEIEETINAGKDIVLTEPSSRGSKKVRRYRKAEPYTFPEALQVAIRALDAHFIQQTLFLASASNEFKAAALNQEAVRFGFREEVLRPDLQTVGQEKEIFVELQAATRISGEGEEFFRVPPIEPAAIEEQRRNLYRLLELLTF